MSAALAFQSSHELPDHAVATRARRLLAVTTELTNAATVDEVAQVVLGTGLGVVEAERGFLCCLENDRLRMIHATGYDQTVLSRVLTLRVSDDTPLTRCMRTGEPVYLSSVDEYRRIYPWAYSQFGAVSQTQAHAALPLKHGNAVIGGLGLSFLQPTAFGAADRTFTVLLAQAAAGALARAVNLESERAGRREAEILAQAREEVLAVVAHDLRNPLNLITSTASLLAEFDPPRERQLELLQIAVRAAKHMNRLIGDLLDAHRIRSGGIALQLEDCDADSILARVEEVMRPAAADRRIVFHVSSPGTAARFVADSSRLAQALGNLVANAFKFTPSGGRVVLRARVGKIAVHFVVSDTGPGIPPETRARLFEKFWQPQPDQRGVGLGLAIVKGIADAHCGRVLVRSQVGSGSAFVISIPRSAGGLVS
jgi:signal transduction histidine kinase